MVDPPIESNEQVYRGVMKSPPAWNHERGEFSRAIFKDDRGLSVDIENGRTEQECIQYMLGIKNWYMIRKLSVSVIENNGCRCFPDLEGGFGNPFHGLILRTDKNPKLSKTVRGEFFEKSVEVFKNA